MQNVNDLTEKEEMIPATELREMTITPQQIYDQQKNNILSQLMHSMVNVAQKNGAKSYQASLNIGFDRKMLSEVLEKFNSLGYVVKSEDKLGTTAGDIIMLSISWNESESNASVQTPAVVQ